MRDGAWKLVRNLPGQKTPALYDLAEDLSETNDLAAQQPKRVQAMLKAIATWQTDVAKGATKQTEKPLSRD
ncbi:MAG: hypothetical protein KatS3mg105_2869 [Gemmatales bacterium]|nr:MAG: hypothetical protein KatS3mg105_2869 [Gemmatales bacterium]